MTPTDFELYFPLSIMVSWRVICLEVKKMASFESRFSVLSLTIFIMIEDIIDFVLSIQMTPWKWDCLLFCYCLEVLFTAKPQSFSSVTINLEKENENKAEDDKRKGEINICTKHKAELTCTNLQRGTFVGLKALPLLLITCRKTSIVWTENTRQLTKIHSTVSIKVHFVLLHVIRQFIWLPVTPPLES